MMSQADKESTHRWNGLPGAYCLDCGAPFVLELALVCPNCYVPYGPEDENQNISLCTEHSNMIKPCPVWVQNEVGI